MHQFFPKLFNPQDLGTSLKEVTSGGPEISPEGIVSRWFHSAKDADLFIWSDSQENIIKQQLSYYGKVIEWNVIEGVKTGHVILEEGRERNHGSEILRFDPKPQMTSIEQAILLLECVTALKDIERKALAANFLKLSASQTMPPEEFIARFGKYMSQPVNLATPSAWKRLFSKLSRWFKI